MVRKELAKLQGEYAARAACEAFEPNKSGSRENVTRTNYRPTPPSMFLMHRPIVEEYALLGKEDCALPYFVGIPSGQ